MKLTDTEKLQQADALLQQYSQTLRSILELQGGDPFPADRLVPPVEASSLIRFRIIKAADKYPQKIRMALEDPAATHELFVSAAGAARASHNSPAVSR